MLKRILQLIFCVVAFTCLLFAANVTAAKSSDSSKVSSVTAAESADTFKVKAYYGEYKKKTIKAGHIAGSLSEPVIEKWTPPEEAKEKYTIGVSFPHLKDPYWLAVNYGIITEARRLGVNIELLAAQGYDDLTGQISQIRNLVTKGVDALIVAPISYTALDPLIKSITKKGIPVINVINDIHAPTICCKAEVSFFGMGYEAGAFLAQDIQDNKHATVALLPGPGGASWSQDLAAGFKQSLADKAIKDKVEIVATRWGDTGKQAQIPLIENVTTANPKLDYLVINAVGANAAADLWAGQKNTPKIISGYAIPPLYEEIKQGDVAAMSVDFTPLQGKMAVDMAVSVLNGLEPGEDFPFRAGPLIVSATPENISDFTYKAMFGGRDWRPVFSVEVEE